MFFGADVEVWGHRGWPTRFPDNVMAGIRAAAEVAERVEVDVRRTVDGRLVLSHDAELGGSTISDTPWSDLAGLDVGEGHHPILLRELLEHPIVLNLEIKNSPTDPGFEPDHAIGMDTAVLARPTDVLTSFFWPTIDAVRQAFPHLSTGLLFERGIPPEAAIDHAEAMGHSSIVPHHPLVDNSVVEEAHARGIAVVTWTVNDPGLARRLADWGVDAIITDDPGTLRDELGMPPKRRSD